MKCKQVDHSMPKERAELRRRNLPADARVLDLFCGYGEMYQSVYKGKVAFYHGVDNKKIHDPKLCTLINNNVYITQKNIEQFNVFDLDDYGSPWKQMFLIMERCKQPEITFFITDGLILSQKVGAKPRFVSGTEQIRKNYDIPGIGRWYIDIFATMLLRLEQRYQYKVTTAEYFHNPRETVYYWHIKLVKKVQN